MCSQLLKGLFLEFCKKYCFILVVTKLFFLFDYPIFIDVVTDFVGFVYFKNVFNSVPL